MTKRRHSAEDEGGDEDWKESAKEFDIEQQPFACAKTSCQLIVPKWNIMVHEHHLKQLRKELQRPTLTIEQWLQRDREDFFWTSDWNLKLEKTSSSLFGVAKCFLHWNGSFEDSFFVVVLNHEMTLRTKFVEAQLTNLTFLPALFLTLTTKCCDTMHTEIKITGKKSFQTFGQTPEESKMFKKLLAFCAQLDTAAQAVIEVVDVSDFLTFGDWRFHWTSSVLVAWKKQSPFNWTNKGNNCLWQDNSFFFSKLAPRTFQFSWFSQDNKLCEFHLFCLVSDRRNWTKQLPPFSKNVKRGMRLFWNAQNMHIVEHPHAGLIHPWFIHESDAPQCHGTSWRWSCCSQVVKKIDHESNTPSSQDGGPRDATTVSCGPLHATGTRFVCNMSCLCDNSCQQAHDWHVNSSRWSTIRLSGERIKPEDLQPDLSQMSHSFLVPSKFTIFFCKQFKRHVAFGAFHFASSCACSCSLFCAECWACAWNACLLYTSDAADE